MDPSEARGPSVPAHPMNMVLLDLNVPSIPCRIYLAKLGPEADYLIAKRHSEIVPHLNTGCFPANGLIPSAGMIMTFRRLLSMSEEDILSATRPVLEPHPEEINSYYRSWKEFMSWLEVEGIRTLADLTFYDGDIFLAPGFKESWKPLLGDFLIRTGTPVFYEAHGPIETMDSLLHQRMTGFRGERT